MLQPFKIRIGLNTRISYPVDQLVKGYFSGYLPFIPSLSSDLKLAFGYLHPEYRHNVIDDFYFHNWNSSENRTLLLRYFFEALILQIQYTPDEIYHKFLFYSIALGNSNIFTPTVTRILNERIIRESLQRAVGNDMDWNSIRDKVLEITAEIDKSKAVSGSDFAKTRVYPSVKLDPIQNLIAEIVYVIRTNPTSINDDMLYEKTQKVLSSLDEYSLNFENENLLRAYFKFLLHQNYLRTACICTYFVNLSYSPKALYSPARIYLFSHLLDKSFRECCTSDLGRYVVKDLLQLHIKEANVFQDKLFLGVVDSKFLFISFADNVFIKHQVPQYPIYSVTSNSKYLNEILPQLFTSPPISNEIATFQQVDRYFGLPVLSFVLNYLHHLFDTTDSTPIEIQDHRFKANPKELNSNQGDLLRGNQCYFLMLYADFVEFTNGQSLREAIWSKHLTFLNIRNIPEYPLLHAFMESSLVALNVKELIAPLYQFIQARQNLNEVSTPLTLALIHYLSL